MTEPFPRPPTIEAETGLYPSSLFTWADALRTRWRPTRWRPPIIYVEEPVDDFEEPVDDLTVDFRKCDPVARRRRSEVKKFPDDVIAPICTAYGAGYTSGYHFFNPFLNQRSPSETQGQHRRGRGKRRNEAYWTDYNSRDDTDPFDGRECLFSDENGNLRTPAMANLDTGLKVTGGLIMSSQYAKELGRYQDISQDFVDPCLRSISGHLTPVAGILRDVSFRLKGTSVTFMRDFFICDAIDGLVDIMFGASFIRNQFKLFFERVKECFSTFAT
ncbi:hypothetical protein MMC22_010162 [Lobaria immixta]|nr:hypothetical protein [Lobaria immixta]